MKHILLFIVVLSFVSLATAGELAELAKSERARREALTKQGIKSRVLTNADISNLKSTFAMELTGVLKPNEIAAKPVEQLQKVSSAEEQRKKEIAEEIDTHREEIEKLKKEIEDQRNAAAESGPYRSRNFGNQHRTIREQEELLKDLEQDLSNLESEKDRQ